MASRDFFFDFVEKKKRDLAERNKKMSPKDENRFFSIGKFDFDLKYIEAIISLCKGIGFKEESETLYVGKCLSYGCTSIISDPEGDILIILFINTYFNLI